MSFWHWVVGIAGVGAGLGLFAGMIYFGLREGKWLEK
jgi:hypothetical protein